MRLLAGTIIITVIILLLIITLAVYGFYALQSYTDELNSLLTSLEKQLKEDNWDQVIETSRQLNKKWEKALTFFPALVNHAELHDLDITLYRIFSLIDLKKRDEIIPEIEIARKLVKNIYEQERPTLRNIF